MTPIARAFHEAHSPAEVLAATTRFLGGEMEREGFERLGIAGRSCLASVDDLEQYIHQVRVALDTLPMTDRDEERAHRLLGYLMLAGMRAQQLS